MNNVLFSLSDCLKKKDRENSQHYGSGRARPAHVATRVVYVQPEDPLQLSYRRQPGGQLVAEECSTDGTGSGRRRENPTRRS